MTREQALKVIDREMGNSAAGFYAAMLSGYVPTIKQIGNGRRMVRAVKALGFNAWNPTTGKNW